MENPSQSTVAAIAAPEQESNNKHHRGNNVTVKKPSVNCLCGHPVVVVEESPEDEEIETDVVVEAEGTVKMCQRNVKTGWKKVRQVAQNGAVEKLTRIFTKRYGLFSGSSYSTELWARNWEILGDD